MTDNHTAVYVTVCALLAVFAICAVLYQHERRADRHQDAINDLAEQLARLDRRLDALAEWDGVVINDPEEDDSPEAMAAEEAPPEPRWSAKTPPLALTPAERAAFDDTDEIPIVPGIPTEPMAVVNPTPAVQARRDAAWDEQRPSPVPRTDSDEAKARKAAWVEEQLREIRARIDAGRAAS